jgi:hypothetical protein
MNFQATLLAFVLLPSMVSASQGTAEARKLLKKWGLGYCLSVYQKTETEHEAGGAMGGYFQLGQHSEEAYKNVRAFFNEKIPLDTRVMQISGKPNNLMRCLDAYESSEFDKLIRAQDKWTDSHKTK